MKIKKKYRVASSAMVLKRVEIPNPAFFDRTTKNRVNVKAKMSELFASSARSAQVDLSDPGSPARTKEEGDAYVGTL